MNKKGFAATGILYTILVLFILLIFGMITMLYSRNNILNRIQNEVKGNLSYVDNVYANGTAVYFNPETGFVCDESEAVSTTGTKTGCMKWYIFNDSTESTTINMILDHNTTATIVWSSRDTSLESDISTWATSVKATARLIEADEVAQITGNTTFNGVTSNYSSTFYLDSNSQTQTATTQGASNYAWLYDYTYDCTSYGCNIADSSNYGYWTSTFVADYAENLWRIDFRGMLRNSWGIVGYANDYGIRPVITIDKSLIVQKISPLYSDGTAVYFNPETGSICDPNDAVSATGTKTGCMKWYTFNDSSSSTTVNMILDHNTTATVAWNSSGSNSEMNEVATALTSDTSTWTSGLNPRLITADEVSQITGNTTFSGSTSTYSDWFFLDSNNQTQTATAQGASKYAWLYDYTLDCLQDGCNISGAGTNAYWTSTPVEGSSNYAWYISQGGRLFYYYSVSDATTYLRGVRPVITIDKSLIDNLEMCTQNVGKEYVFDYTGGEQQFIAPCDGTYQLEVWGAQGGAGYVTGGTGGYSIGNISASENTLLYVIVGGQGTTTTTSTGGAGGYNGGGTGGSGYGSFKGGGGGGGATHIAKESGLLSTLSSSKASVLLVAGGGGGGGNWSSPGKGGGTTGSDSTSFVTGVTYSVAGATQTSGYAFGKGQAAYNRTTSNSYGAEGMGGGGGGYYGGYAGQSDGFATDISGGGGSGYIGNVTDGSTSQGVRSGDGYAKITLLSVD